MTSGDTIPQHERTTLRDARASDADGLARVHLLSSDEAYAPLAKDWPAPDHRPWGPGFLAGLGAALDQSVG